MRIMRITSIETIPFRIPFPIPNVWARGRMDAAEHVLVKVKTDEGITGIAECIPRETIYGETQQSIMVAIKELIAPNIIGCEVTDTEKIWEEMNQIAWNPCAKSAIDMAVHDILGKMTKLPVYKLLGGWTNEIELTWIVSLKSIPDMVQEASKKFDEGFRCFKLKAGVNPQDDLSMVKEMRRQLGDEARLYIDANEGYDFHTALDTLLRMEEYQIAMVEEPLPRWDSDGRKRLAERIRMPILGDDSVFTPFEAANEIKNNSIGVVNIKPARTGCTLSRKIIHLAESANLPVQIGSQAETSVGALAAYHIGCAFKQMKYPAESRFLWAGDSLLMNPLEVKNGRLKLSDQPGFGIEIDEQKLEKYRVKLANI